MGNSVPKKELHCRPSLTVATCEEVEVGAFLAGFQEGRWLQASFLAYRKPSTTERERARIVRDPDTVCGVMNPGSRGSRGLRAGGAYPQLFPATSATPPASMDALPTLSTTGGGGRLGRGPSRLSA
jgi:hypothetical protein